MNMKKSVESIIKEGKLRILNEVNGAHMTIMKYAESSLEKFEGTLHAVIMGSAWGGEVEALARMWKGRGYVYGYDTFEDLHPKHLADKQDSFEAVCMDGWYKEYGTKELAYDYQRKCLDEQGLENAILVKGEVNKMSCANFPYINLAFLDMDLIVSMKNGWEAVKDKICQTGYVFFHDAIPDSHLPDINHWVFDELIPQNRDKWDVEGVWRPQFLVGLVRK